MPVVGAATSWLYDSPVVEPLRLRRVPLLTACAGFALGDLLALRWQPTLLLAASSLILFLLSVISLRRAPRVAIVPHLRALDRHRLLVRADRARHPTADRSPSSRRRPYPRRPGHRHPRSYASSGTAQLATPSLRALRLGRRPRPPIRSPSTSRCSLSNTSRPTSP